MTVPSPVPYLLLVAAAAIIAIGLRRTGGVRKPSAVPWGPLLVWALLVAVGVSVWLASAR